MKLSEAVAGNIYEPAPAPTDFPPPTDVTPGPGLEPLTPGAVAAEDEDPGGWLYLGDPPDERGVVTGGVDPGPVDQPVTSGADDGPVSRSGVARDALARGARDATVAGQVALGVSRAVGDRVFDGVPGVDDLANKGARKVSNAAAGAAKGGLLANNWAGFGKYRTSWEA